MFLKLKSLLRNNLDMEENDRKADESALVTGIQKSLQRSYYSQSSHLVKEQ